MAQVGEILFMKNIHQLIFKIHNTMVDDTVLTLFPWNTPASLQKKI